MTAFDRAQQQYDTQTPPYDEVLECDFCIVDESDGGLIISPDCQPPCDRCGWQAGRPSVRTAWVRDGE